MAELETGGFATAEAYPAKEPLHWVRQARTTQAARWRLTHFLRHVDERLSRWDYMLDPVREAVETVRRHATRISRRWLSGYSNARLEALNGLLQATGVRARDYQSIEPKSGSWLIANSCESGRFGRHEHRTARFGRSPCG